MTKCIGIKSNSKQCTRNTSHNSQVCWQHQPQLGSTIVLSQFSVEGGGGTLVEGAMGVHPQLVTPQEGGGFFSNLFKKDTPEKKAEKEKIARQKAEKEAKLKADKLETQRIQAEMKKIQDDKLKAQKLEIARLKSEKIKADKLEAERIKAEKKNPLARFTEYKYGLKDLAKNATQWPAYLKPLKSIIVPNPIGGFGGSPPDFALTYYTKPSEWVLYYDTKKYGNLNNQLLEDIVDIISAQLAKIKLIPFLTKGVSWDSFEIIKKLGQGAFGEVYSARNKLGAMGGIPPTTVVIKKILKSKASPEDILKELDVLNYLRPYCQKYVLCYDGFFEDTDAYYITTEFLGHYVNLGNAIKDNAIENPILQLKIAKNIVDGLKYIHAHEVAHRDIKPENIMVDLNNGDIKYIDFGTSCHGTLGCSVDDYVGTTPYMAPELFTPKKHFNINDLKAIDIWATGITLYMLFTDKLPLDVWATTNNYTKELKSNPQSLNVKFIRQYNFTEDSNFWQFVAIKKIHPKLDLLSMLNRDPTKRLGGY